MILLAFMDTTNCRTEIIYRMARNAMISAGHQNLKLRYTPMTSKMEAPFALNFFCFVFANYSIMKRIVINIKRATHLYLISLLVTARKAKTRIFKMIINKANNLYCLTFSFIKTSLNFCMT